MIVLTSRNQSVIPWIAFAVLVPLVGAAVAFAGPAAAFVAIAVASLVSVMAMPVHLTLLIELVLATVVAGTVEYFGGITQSHWIPYLLGLLLGFRALVEYVGHGRGSRPGPSQTVPGPWFSPLTYIYLLILVASTLLNLPPFIQVIVGAKNYLFMWGVFAALTVMRNFDSFARKVWSGLILIVVLQLPVVLYQKFFIARNRSAAGGSLGVAWDAIVGTFGGDPTGGGHSAAMALFVTIVFFALLVGWREGRRSAKPIVLFAVLALPTVFLAEVKAVVVWLAIGAAIIFARHVLHRPLLFVGGTLGMFALLASLIVAYNAMYYDQGKDLDLGRLYDKQIAYVFDANKFNSETREMGRVASVVFWWQRHSLEDPTALFLGHGIGSSRGSSSMAVGEVARHYSFYIDTSAATALLWDVGLLGFVAFFGVVVLGAIQGLQLGQDPRISTEARANAEAAGVGLILIATGLPYSRDAVDCAAVQFLLFFLLASVSHARAMAGRRTKDVPRSRQ